MTAVFDDLIDFLACSEFERILNFHPSETTQKRVEQLLKKKYIGQLSLKEKRELEYFLMLEHVIRLAKARALKGENKSKTIN